MEIIPLDTANPNPPKMGRPALNHTPEDRKKVQHMAGLGLRQTAIALIMEISARSLRRHYRKELDAGSAFAEHDVLQSLFEMAISRRNSSATIFWAKTRCDFVRKNTQSSKEQRASQPSPKYPTPKLKRRSSLEGLTVHLNDGAPNGEF
jgi:hypothetical protein